MWINLSRQCDFFSPKYFIYAMACMERSGKISIFNVFIPFWLPWKKSGSSDMSGRHECCAQWPKPLAWCEFCLWPWSVCVQSSEISPLPHCRLGITIVLASWNCKALPNENFTKYSTGLHSQVPRKCWTAPAFLRRINLILSCLLSIVYSSNM